MYLTILIILIFLAILIIFIISTYNKIIRLRNSVKRSKSGIDISLNQRFDLIPNLVECVKGYTNYEKELLTNIAKQRTEYFQNKNMKKAIALNNTLNKIMAVSENYPDLKANEQFINLQHNLSKIETQLQVTRRIYNFSVQRYNTKIQTIPTNIIANAFGFKEEEYFQIEEYKKENININGENI